MAAPLAVTLVPFSDTGKLPACAVACQPLWDANGGCVPPAVAPADEAAYTSCFCRNQNVAPFSTAVTGICDNACPGNPQALSSIGRWFSSACNVQARAAGSPQTATTTSSAGATNVPGSSANNGQGGDWISNHWQWVIMLVFLVVGITALWVGACIWRRRYLRKKDRQTSLGQKHSGSATNPSWGPTVTGSDSSTPMTFPPGRDAEQGVSEKTAKNKSEKKKWRVLQRT